MPVIAGAQIHEHRLKNGLRVLILERHLDPIVAVMVYYGVGARDEQEYEAGLSHFLEHMMFKGSANFAKGEVDRRVTALGGSINAFTTPDHTAYWFELASDRWELALEIEADRMANLSLDEAEFDSERAVVLEELSMGEDDPWRKLTHQVQEVMFARHPYRRPVIGYADVLERLTVADMRDFYGRFYGPDNATLVLSGAVDPKSALKLVRKHFGSIPRRSVSDAREPLRPQMEEPTGERRLTTTWDDPAARLCMAWPTAAFTTPDDFTLDLVAGVLSSGRLSRLYRRIVLERGLATSISASNDTRVDGGSFWIYAQCVQGVAPEELERAIDEELGLMRSERVGAKELTRAKKSLAAAVAYEGETVTDLAEDIGSFAVDADWPVALERTERRNRVTAAVLRTCVQRYLTPQRRVVGWSLPQAEASR
ncbi:MAG: zinc protease [Chlamydiales bacterium]|jgi:zinc protease